MTEDEWYTKFARALAQKDYDEKVGRPVLNDCGVISLIAYGGLSVTDVNLWQGYTSFALDPANYGDDGPEEGPSVETDNVKALNRAVETILYERGWRYAWIPILGDWPTFAASVERPNRPDADRDLLPVPTYWNGEQ